MVIFAMSATTLIDKHSYVWLIVIGIAGLLNLLFFCMIIPLYISIRFPIVKAKLARIFKKYCSFDVFKRKHPKSNDTDDYKLEKQQLLH